MKSDHKVFTDTFPGFFLDGIAKNLGTPTLLNGIKGCIS